MYFAALVYVRSATGNSMQLKSILETALVFLLRPSRAMRVHKPGPGPFVVKNLVPRASFLFFQAADEI